MRNGSARRPLVRGGQRRASALRDTRNSETIGGDPHTCSERGRFSGRGRAHARVPRRGEPRRDRWRMAAAAEAVRDADTLTNADGLRPASIRRARWEWRVVKVLRLWRVRMRDIHGPGPAVPPSELRVAAMTARRVLWQTDHPVAHEGGIGQQRARTEHDVASGVRRGDSLQRAVPLSHAAAPCRSRMRSARSSNDGACAARLEDPFARGDGALKRTRSACCQSPRRPTSHAHVPSRKRLDDAVGELLEAS